jgi:hypothetical protein
MIGAQRAGKRHGDRYSPSLGRLAHTFGEYRQRIFRRGITGSARIAGKMRQGGDKPHRRSRNERRFPQQPRRDDHRRLCVDANDIELRRELNLFEPTGRAYSGIEDHQIEGCGGNQVIKRGIELSAIGEIALDMRN